MTKIYSCFLLILPWFTLGLCNDDKKLFAEISALIILSTICILGKFSVNKKNIILAVFAALLCILLAFNKAGFLGVSVFKQYMYGILIYLTVQHITANQNQGLILKSIAWSGILLSLYGIAVRLLSQQYIICDKNVYATTLLLCFPFVFLLAKQYKILAIVSYTIAMALSGSRGGFVVYSLVCLILLWPIVKNKLYFLSIIPALLIPHFLGYINWVEAYTQIVNMKIGRGIIWPEAIKTIIAHPLGTGIGRMCIKNPGLSVDMFGPHNIIADIWGNLSIFGLAIIAFILYRFFINCTSQAGLLAKLSVFGAITYGLVDPSYNNSLPFIYIVTILALAYHAPNYKVLIINKYVKAAVICCCIWLAVVSYQHWYGLRSYAQGIKLANKGKLIESLQYLRECETVIPNYNRLYYERGKIWYSLKDYKTSMHDFARCEKYYPDWANNRQLLKLLIWR